MKREDDALSEAYKKDTAQTWKEKSLGSTISTLLPTKQALYFNVLVRFNQLL